MDLIRKDPRMRVGIVGFAGSGKSTLFQLLTGTRPIRARSMQARWEWPRFPIRAGLPGDAPQAEEGDAGHRRVPRYPWSPPRLTRRQPATPRPDPRRRCSLGRAVDSQAVTRLPNSPPFATNCSSPTSSVVTNRAERLEASIKKPRPDREHSAKELDSSSASRRSRSGQIGRVSRALRRG